ncbi:hypothetical protein OJF2_58450 [Aquisphaera giovannonii]|uniref:DUF1579 domain-containing protein n=1 Tax=Aquisphaera giovannonii TaxID=406548 RepID=A0A5B9W9E5_9BACT|nr:DUF1579 family protein [Aquisphaera giovannonii]QEH37258.1 hypothetical protein OJF2_58450 [Aquisphaera giovannonii]
MRSSTRGIVACLLLSAMAGLAGAQEPKPFEPRSAPGVGQKFLETMAGRWTVTKVIHRGDNPIKTPGECRQYMIQGGRFLQSDFAFGDGEKRETGTGIIGFEPENGKFTSFWFESRQTRMSARRSREPFDGSRIVLYSLNLDPDQKETRRTRTESHLEDEGRTLIHRQYLLGGPGEERLVMELIMKRKG